MAGFIYFDKCALTARPKICVSIYFFRIEVPEFQDGHHHFLQTHAAMDKVQAAALGLEPYLFTGSKTLEITAATCEAKLTN